MCRVGVVNMLKLIDKIRNWLRKMQDARCKSAECRVQSFEDTSDVGRDSPSLTLSLFTFF